MDLSSALEMGVGLEVLRVIGVGFGSALLDMYGRGGGHEAFAGEEVMDDGAEHLGGGDGVCGAVGLDSGVVDRGCGEGDGAGGLLD